MSTAVVPQASRPPAAGPLAIGPDDNGILLTTEEFDAIEEYDEEYCYELINGVLIVSPIPSDGERDPNEELGRFLRNYGDDHPGVLDATLFEEYVYLTNSRRRADRVVWAGLGRVPDKKVDVPTIVVEFVSKRRRDRQRDYVLKRDEYLALGVQEYWVIDRFQRSMTVFRSSKGKNVVLTVKETDSYQTPLLPGFELKLSSILERADYWQDETD